MPGGIKLCSPGTFWVANYLIINNGSYQVNFMKPNRATIRYTNSQSLREDAPEMPVGMVCLLGECHELGSEGTEWMEIIAGVRLVAQTERGGSAVRARSERGWGAVSAQLERG